MPLKGIVTQFGKIAYLLSYPELDRGIDRLLYLCDKMKLYTTSG